MEKFEYKVWNIETALVQASTWVKVKVFPDSFSDEINKLGLEGWELVSVVTFSISRLY